MNKSPFISRLLSLLSVLLCFSTVSLHAQREKLPPEDRDFVEKKWPDAKRTYTGLRYIVLQKPEKEGSSPVPGMVVSVHYKGMLLNGTVFDETPDPEHPLSTRLGRGELIDGWEEAIQRMQKGEKWLLIVPPEMAYGARGRPPTIPRYSTLIFEMELVDFHEK